MTFKVMEITNRISENTGDSWEEVDCEVGVCVWERARRRKEIGPGTQKK